MIDPKTFKMILTISIIAICIGITIALHFWSKRKLKEIIANNNQ